jgi:hypothetical protein
MKKIRKLLTQEVVYAEEKPKKEKKKAEYTNLVEPKELEITDNSKLVFSASQMAGDKDNNVHVDIRTYIVNADTSKYSGPTQRGVNFDVEYLDEFIETLKEVSKELKKKNK